MHGSSVARTGRSSNDFYTNAASQPYMLQRDWAHARLQFTAGELDLPAVGPAYCQLAVVIFPLAHGPQHPKRRLSWLKETNLKRRTNERQNTQREKHATAQRQRAHVHSSHAAHAAGAPLAAHPAPNRAGRPCRALLYVPRGVNLDLT